MFSLNSEDYKSHFPNRNLMAYSTHPLLVQPCHYAGDPEWVSDTETSTLWDDDNVRTDWRGSHKTLKGSQPPAGLQSATYKDELWSAAPQPHEWHEWAFSKSSEQLFIRANVTHHGDLKTVEETRKTWDQSLGRDFHSTTTTKKFNQYFSCFPLKKII